MAAFLKAARSCFPHFQIAAERRLSHILDPFRHYNVKESL
nr:MAG TPA: hypothetical protein [Bacteriophage sp.]